MKKFLSFILLTIITSTVFGQLNVKKNYTNPWFQANIRIVDTLGIDNLIKIENSTIQDDGGGGLQFLNNSGATSSYSFQNQNGTTIGNFALGFTQGIFEQTGLSSTGKIKLNFGVTNPSLILESDASSGGFQHEIVSITPTANRIATLPDTSGTFAFLSDIPATNNLYLNDDTITSDRSVYLDTFDLSFIQTTGIINIGSVGKTVNINGLKMPLFDGATNQVLTTDGVQNLTLQNSQNIYNNDGALSGSRTVNMAANDLVFTRTTGNFGVGLSSPLNPFEVGLGNTNGVFGLYADRVAGASVSDNQNINFYYNDNTGTRTLGTNNISSRVAAVGAGSVTTDVLIGSQFKVLGNGNTLFHPSAATQPASAFVHIKETGTDNNIGLLVDGNGNTASQSIFWARNLAQNSLFRIDGAGKGIFNDANLTGGDFNIQGSTENNLFFADASQNSIGLGTAGPSNKTLLELSSTTRGFLMSRMTETQRNAITSVPTALMLYNTDSNTIDYYDGTAWQSLLHNGKEFVTNGFADSSITIAMTQNLFHPVTNAANTLYTHGINVGAVQTGDSIQVQQNGYYSIEWDLSYSGANTDVYHIYISVNGTPQEGKGETNADLSSNDAATSGGHTLLYLAANSWVKILIQNIANNNDATVNAGNLKIIKI